jgi:hypothetical protein
VAAAAASVTEQLTDNVLAAVAVKAVTLIFKAVTDTKLAAVAAL